jgi:hypothetical protein
MATLWLNTLYFVPAVLSSADLWRFGKFLRLPGGRGFTHASKGNQICGNLRRLAFLSAWIHQRLFPVLEEFIGLARAVQVRKARHLPAYWADALREFWIFEVAGAIEFLPRRVGWRLARARARRGERDRPLANCSSRQIHPRSSGDANQAEHLAVKFFKAIRSSPFKKYTGTSRLSSAHDEWRSSRRLEFHTAT